MTNLIFRSRYIIGESQSTPVEFLSDKIDLPYVWFLYDRDLRHERVKVSVNKKHAKYRVSHCKNSPFSFHVNMLVVCPTLANEWGVGCEKQDT